MNLNDLAKEKTDETTVSTTEMFNDNPQAQRVVELVNNKHPFIFLTGKAGTGKTTLVKELIKAHKQSTMLVASTGIAALNVGGQTIHSAFKFKPQIFFEIDVRAQPPSSVFRLLQLLVIDEVSMLRADLMQAIDVSLRKWRKKPNVPFGGVVVLAVGDLLQLPPVVNNEEEKVFYEVYTSPWFFSAPVFNDVDAEVVELQKTYRQSDPVFINVLNRIRSNLDHRDAVAKLNRECYRDIGERHCDITLCTTNAQADRINQQKLDATKTPRVVFTGEFEGDFPRRGRLPAPLELVLKLNAQVMVTKNIGSAVNGSLGIVEELAEDHVKIRLKDSGTLIKVSQESWDNVNYENKNGSIEANVNGRYKQLPLTLGWAITIHKSQGLTLDNVEIDLGRQAFASGQTYVALSRCRRIEGIKLTRPISMKDVITDPVILNFYANLADHDQGCVQEE